MLGVLPTVQMVRSADNSVPLDLSFIGPPSTLSTLSLKMTVTPCSLRNASALSPSDSGLPSKRRGPEWTSVTALPEAQAAGSHVSEDRCESYMSRRALAGVGLDNLCRELDADGASADDDNALGLAHLLGCGLSGGRDTFVASWALDSLIISHLELGLPGCNVAALRVSEGPRAVGAARGDDRVVKGNRLAALQRG